jgi:KDO2-lipid IV(A) lauroyltransferase
MKFIEFFITIFLKIISFLPQRLQYFIGRFVGSILYKFLNERKEIARWNLKKCFPEFSLEQIEEILKKNFSRLGESIFEFLSAFWASDKRIKKLIINFDEIKNTADNLDPKKGKLILLLHTVNVDMAARASSLFLPVSGMAKVQSIKILDNLLNASREKFCERIFRPHEGSDFLSFLKDGKANLYAPDQDYGYQHSLFVDFFGHKALTVKFPSILVERTNCEVLLFTLDKKGNSYEASLKKLDLDGKDIETDLIKINSAVENYIRKCPDNYLWMHRRFKNRPEGEESFYPKNLLRNRSG